MKTMSIMSRIIMKKMIAIMRKERLMGEMKTEMGEKKKKRRRE
jgi:hypothetical protein